MSVDLGTDTSCTDRYRAGQLVSGTTLVAEAIYRRLTTPRGDLFYDLTYGLDVRRLLGKGMTPVDLKRIPDQVEAEIRKDPRIDETAVTARFSPTSSPTSVAVEMAIRCTTAAGPFEFVLGVTQLTVEILSR